MTDHTIIAHCNTTGYILKERKQHKILLPHMPYVCDNFKTAYCSWSRFVCVKYYQKLLWQWFILYCCVSIYWIKAQK